MNLYEAEVIIKTREAAEKAKLENKTTFVKKLLVKGDYSVDVIAEIAEVPVEFVLQIREQLSGK